MKLCNNFFNIDIKMDIFMKGKYIQFVKLIRNQFRVFHIIFEKLKKSIVRK